MAWPLTPMMCEPERLTATSSASSPLIRSASSTARVIDSTAASGSTTTPLRKPFASASPMPITSTSWPSPGSPMMQVTRLVPMSRPTVCDACLAIRVSLLRKQGVHFTRRENFTHPLKQSVLTSSGDWDSPLRPGRTASQKRTTAGSVDKATGTKANGLDKGDRLARGSVDAARAQRSAARARGFVLLLAGLRLPRLLLRVLRRGARSVRGGLSRGARVRFRLLDRLGVAAFVQLEARVLAHADDCALALRHVHVGNEGAARRLPLRVEDFERL